MSIGTLQRSHSGGGGDRRRGHLHDWKQDKPRQEKIVMTWKATIVDPNFSFPGKHLDKDAVRYVNRKDVLKLLMASAGGQRLAIVDVSIVSFHRDVWRLFALKPHRDATSLIYQKKQLINTYCSTYFNRILSSWLPLQHQKRFGELLSAARFIVSSIFPLALLGQVCRVTVMENSSKGFGIEPLTTEKAVPGFWNTPLQIHLPSRELWFALASHHPDMQALLAREWISLPLLERLEVTPASFPNTKLLNSVEVKSVSSTLVYFQMSTVTKMSGEV